MVVHTKPNFFCEDCLNWPVDKKRLVTPDLHEYTNIVHFVAFLVL